ncbi:unnamed protein product [Brassicogethes aeneus]|uniref:Uncharacterized protein n=1 Tax=Brassicogethes aeneus TaxID=1431903 RepID=A0A9P0BCW1_BRAAE|nr:unnamed protein product [Brassicogethes aeneus]
MKKIVEKRRTAVRQRVQNHRKKSKTNALQEQSGTNAATDVTRSYQSTQALGKAVKKTMKALPVMDTRKIAVLAKIVTSMNDDDRNKFQNIVSPSGIKKKKDADSELVDKIGKFYKRDDISRISPKIKDVKRYFDLKTGEKILLPTRHMLLTVKEAFVIFDKERKTAAKAIFVQSCEHNCWFSKCNECNGIPIELLKKYIGGMALNTPVKWMVWRKNDTSKRIEKHEKSDSLESLLLHITKISPQFLRHSYVKREQSDIFNNYDCPRSTDKQLSEEGTLQVDFAENFVCEGQDEVQSAHWNQKQLTVFTTAFHLNEKFQSKVFVSNNLAHTKETIVPYMYILLSGVPESVKILKIWSDGPSSQFKNKFIAAVIPVLEDKFGIKIYWNYFATSHGKGCIDGIGATAKMIVKKQILSRKCIVNCASDVQ